MPSIHCVGVLVVDLLNGPIKQYPVPRKQTQITAEWIRMAAGGGAANTPSALARMGAGVTAFSKVGNDPNGSFVLNELKQVGVDTAGVCVSAKDSTPFTFVGIHGDGDRTFIHTPGANLTFTVADIEKSHLLDCDYLLYQDLWVLPGLDGQPAASLLQEARQRGVVTFLDEAYGYGPKRELLEIMLPHCDYVMPSFDDLQAIYPNSSARDLADRLIGLGAGAAVIKMGAKGCFVAKGDKRVEVCAYPANVVDTTGAGDCWDAGFITALSRGNDPVTAAQIGCACAAYGIEAVGGATGVPHYDTVCQRAQ
jgi:sugar/nucleoside kinase (ribokinase family)